MMQVVWLSGVVSVCHLHEKSIMGEVFFIHVAGLDTEDFIFKEVLRVHK